MDFLLPLQEVFDTHRPMNPRILLVSCSLVSRRHRTWYLPLGFSPDTIDGNHENEPLHPFQHLCSEQQCNFKANPPTVPTGHIQACLSVGFSVVYKLGTFPQKFWTTSMGIYSVQSISPTQHWCTYSRDSRGSALTTLIYWYIPTAPDYSLANPKQLGNYWELLCWCEHFNKK